MRNILLLTLATAMLISCASKHPGNFGKPMSGKKNIQILVSGKTENKKSDSPFQQIEITIENTSADWVRITRAEVVNEDPSKTKISVVVGNDLVSWTEANEYERVWKNHNEQMAAAGIMAAGAAVAIGGARSNNAGVAGAGLGTMIGAATVSDMNKISKAQQEAQSALKIPSHHLYNPFSVPGKMFIRKWLLMNKPVGVMIDTLVIEFETIEGVKETYAIKI